MSIAALILIFSNPAYQFDDETQELLGEKVEQIQAGQKKPLDEVSP